MIDAEQFYYQEMCNHDLLTREDESDLLVRAHNGDKLAEDELINHNQRLVLKIAKGYYFHRSATDVIELTDLIQSGNIGLLKAIRMFDTSAGTRLSTYATYWIKNHVRRQIVEHTFPVRPVYRVGDMIFSISQIRTNLQQKMEREPSDYELIEYISEKIPNVKFSERDLAKLNGLGRCISFDTDSYDFEGDDIYPHEIIEDDNLNVEDDIEIVEMQQTIYKALAKLDPRLCLIITLHFGLDGNGERSYKEIGEIMHFTKSRAQQLGNDALRLLKGTKEFRSIKLEIVD